MTGSLFDQMPIWLLFAVFVVLSFAVYEVGFRIGKWYQDRTPDKVEEGPTGLLVGSVLGLFAFLLAVTMGMAADRYDTRRVIVVDEANAIETTYLRAGFLPSPQREASRALLADYVPQRIWTSQQMVVDGSARSLEIQDELWQMTEGLAPTESGSEVFSLYVDSLNEMIDLHTTRYVAGIYARVPETVVYLLVAGTLLAMGISGYNSGLSRQRSLIGAGVLVVVIGAVLVLVVDLDRPRDGFITISQQAMIDLQDRLGAPPP